MLTTLYQMGAWDQVGFPILTFLIFFPLIGAALLWVFPMDSLRLRWWALANVVTTFILSLWLLPTFVTGVSDMQFVETLPWIRELGISYHIGADGISVPLIILTTFLFVLMILFSWHTPKDHLREYLSCLLVLECTLVGVFAALDLVLFFLFWEVMLVPMYFLIKIWGGARREYAALKFVLYTLAGSVLMLVGFAVLYLNYHHYALIEGLSTPYSASLIDLLRMPIAPETQGIIFWLLFFGFAFKIPLVPFHTWLPDAHVEAPTAGSVVLAGVLLKMGTYGFVRFSMPLLPEASWHFLPYVLTLAAGGIAYGAWLALAQDDIKKLIAYSSISHLGFVVLGLFAMNPTGLSGGLMQMLNHGISTAGLFFVVGFLYERCHTRQISDYGGLMKPMPRLAVFYLIITFASMAFPGTNGFVGEFLILTGALKGPWIFGVVAVVGVLFGAAYLLWLYQRIVFGDVKNAGIADLTARESAICVALVAVILWLGLYPQPLLHFMDGSVQFVLNRLEMDTATLARHP